jgi:hypothetical protein
VTRARAAAGTLALASLPYWLPDAVVALRMRIFTLVNGDEGIAIPGRTVDAAHFHVVYAHPAANGRSRGAALSDLFWYWLSPGPELHQEHLEPGRRYAVAAVARTRRPRREHNDRTARHRTAPRKPTPALCRTPRRTRVAAGLPAGKTRRRWPETGAPPAPKIRLATLAGRPAGAASAVPFAQRLRS